MSEASGGGLGGLLVGLRAARWLALQLLVGAGAGAGQASSPSRSDMGVEPGGAAEVEFEPLFEACGGRRRARTPPASDRFSKPQRRGEQAPAREAGQEVPAKGSSRFAAASDGAGTAATPVASTGMEKRSSSEPTESIALVGRGSLRSWRGSGSSGRVIALADDKNRSALGTADLDSFFGDFVVADLESGLTARALDDHRGVKGLRGSIAARHPPAQVSTRPGGP